MIFKETKLPGAYLVELEEKRDERGFFARTFCREQFSARGLEPAVAQCNLSHNTGRHTLRGMHYQAEPYGEAKLVQCLIGAIYDVIIDLRKESPAFGHWACCRLAAGEMWSLYVPRGMAHGFLTLTDDTLVHYQMSNFYAPQAARGVRWNDPAFKVKWPVSDPIISEKDRSWPDYGR